MHESKEPTMAEMRVFQYIVWHIAHREVPPSEAEIQRGLGYKSSTSVQPLIQSLEQRGYISRMYADPNGELKNRSIPRTIRIMRKDLARIAVPGAVLQFHADQVEYEAGANLKAVGDGRQ